MYVNHERFALGMFSRWNWHAVSPTARGDQAPTSRVDETLRVIRKVRAVIQRVKLMHSSLSQAFDRVRLGTSRSVLCGCVCGPAIGIGRFFPGLKSASNFGGVFVSRHISSLALAVCTNLRPQTGTPPVYLLVLPG